MILLLVAVIFTGCASLLAASGGLQKRMEVDVIFDSGEILPGHTYYVDGVLNDPVAIIALSNDYQLQSELWMKIELTSEELSKMVAWMRIDEVGFCTNQGGVLTTPDGKEIGVWFSKKDTTTIREPTPGVVEIFPFMHAGASACARQELRDSR